MFRIAGWNLVVVELSWSFLLKVCHSVLNSLLLIAQAEAAKPEVELTTGQMLVTVVAMGVFVASFVTVVRCFLRWKDGQVVMAAAQRKPLHVPTAVAVIGVMIAALLASAATAASLDETLVAKAAQQQQQPADHADHADPAAVGDGDGDVAEPDPKLEAVAWNMISGILGMNGVLLFLFGTLVWLTQADGSGRSVPIHEGGSNDSQKASTPATQIRNLDTSFAEFVGDFQVASLNLQADDKSRHSDQLAEGSSPEIHERWNLFAELKFAGLAFLMALVPTIATRLVVVSLMPKPKSHPFIEMMEGGGLNIQLLVLLMLIATISAPIVEELVYRVVVLGGLLNHRSSWVAIGVSAVLFSFAHGFPDCISLLPLAVILGYTYVQRRSYRTVMLVHFMFNAFNMSLALLQMVGES